MFKPRTIGADRGEERFRNYYLRLRFKKLLIPKEIYKNISENYFPDLKKSTYIYFRHSRGDL